MDVDARLEEDLRWRESELTTLKLLAAQARKGGEKQIALLRALTAMLYAHYEGFCKYALELYVDAIRQSGTKTGDLVRSIRVSSLEAVFKKARTLPSGELLDFSEKFNSFCANRTFDSITIDTQSNLWCAILEGLVDSVDIQLSAIDANRTELNSLVGQRNDIAHGRKLQLKNLEDYGKLETAVLDVIYELTIAVADAVSAEAFKVSTLSPIKPPVSSAPSPPFSSQSSSPPTSPEPSPPPSSRRLSPS